MFLEQVRRDMEAYFDTDRKRIEHALQVTGYARSLLESIDADEQVTLAAAYLHDIGIHEAERKYGSCGGRYQEIEGPAVARQILLGLKADAAFIETVCEIIGKHHTPAGVDSPEFRILWDADALVNLQEVVPGKSTEEIEAVLRKSMVTEPGYRMARRQFLPDATELQEPVGRASSS